MSQESDWPKRRMDCRVEPGNDEGVFALRPYTAADEDAAITLWLVTWQKTYPQFDFAARLSWWREHWRKLAQVAKIVVASDARASLIGFVTIEPSTHYLDQLVVAPDYWGKAVGGALMDEAKRLASDFIDLDVNTDNARALGFYRKQGFVVTGDGVNSFSGRPVHHLRWRA
ncbi:MAG: GNAT family N-acetyltransferase [Xanthobacteraceae bacterium]